MVSTEVFRKAFDVSSQTRCFPIVIFPKHVYRDPYAYTIVKLLKPIKVAANSVDKYMFVNDRISETEDAVFCGNGQFVV